MATGKAIRILGVPLALLGLAYVGCATRDPQLVDAKQRVDTLETELAQREATIQQSQSEIARLSQELQSAKLPAVSAAPPPSKVGGSDLLPPAAKAGECYARAFVPPTYQSKKVQVTRREASSRIEVAPAKYGSEEQRVLVREASQKLETIPATYGWVEENVLVKAASTRLVEVPAVYGYETERVLVKPAHTVWKKGRGPVEKIDNATGEIMCLVEIPAEYKTVKRRVLKTPTTTRTIEIPAEHKIVKKRIVKTPPTTRTIEIPAEYQTVKVRKVIEPARERRFEIPAEYDTVTQREMVVDGRMEWRQVLCETNMTRDTVAAIQRALASAGHSPGPIDGVIGRETLGAVRAYQQAQKLPTGGITIATLNSLGVQVGR